MFGFAAKHWWDFVTRYYVTFMSRNDIMWRWPPKCTQYSCWLVISWILIQIQESICYRHLGCFYLFCNVRVYVCVGFVTCGCFGTYILLAFTVFCVVCTVLFVLFRLCIFILICFVCTGVRATATEWQLNCT
jgi:hypothetical protein